MSKAKLVHEEDREDMRREVQLLKHLNGNDHIVHFIAAYEDKVRSFLNSFNFIILVNVR